MNVRQPRAEYRQMARIAEYTAQVARRLADGENMQPCEVRARLSELKNCVGRGRAQFDAIMRCICAGEGVERLVRRRTLERRRDARSDCGRGRLVGTRQRRGSRLYGRERAVRSQPPVKPNGIFACGPRNTAFTASRICSGIGRRTKKMTDKNKRPRKLTEREKKERAKIREQLRAEGLLPPTKKALNHKKFIEAAEGGALCRRRSCSIRFLLHLIGRWPR